MQRVFYRSVYFVQKNSRNNHKCPECISKLQHKPWPAKLYYNIEDDHVLNQGCGGFHTCALLGKNKSNEPTDDCRATVDKIPYDINGDVVLKVKIRNLQIP